MSRRSSDSCLIEKAHEVWSSVANANMSTEVINRAREVYEEVIEDRASRSMDDEVFKGILDNAKGPAEVLLVIETYEQQLLGYHNSGPELVELSKTNTVAAAALAGAKKRRMDDCDSDDERRPKRPLGS